MRALAIRTATLRDLPALKRVIDATGLFPSELLDDLFPADTDADEQDAFWLTGDDSDDHPVAVVYCAPEQMTSGTWNLLLIAVHPDQQGKGFGRQLMAYIEQRLHAMHVRVLLVETSGKPDFARTRAFYEQIGYEREARIRDYYDAGDDKIVFRKALQE